MRRFVAGLVMCAAVGIAGTGTCLAAAFGTAPGTVEPPPSATGYRYLVGREVSLKGTKLVTTVGTYDIGNVPDVENRVVIGGASGASKARPQVELVFQGSQLVKVVIY